MPMEYLLETTMNLTPQTVQRVMAMVEVERANGTSPQSSDAANNQQKLSTETFGGGKQGREN